MARPQTGETKVPVIVALVFFVLTTLMLGVMTYMAYSEMAGLQTSANKAADDLKSAQKLQKTAEEKALLLKVAVGIADENDRTNLQNMVNADEVKKEWVSLQQQVANQVAGAVRDESRKFVGTGGALRVDPTEVFRWDWPEGGKLAAAPSRTMIDQMVAFYAAQQLGQRQTESERRQLTEAKDSAARAQKAAEDMAARYKAGLDALPGLLAAEAKKYDQIAQDARSKFVDDTNKYVEAKKADEKTLSEKDLAMSKVQEDLRKAQTVIANQDAVLNAKEDPFEFDKPHGKILRRLQNDLVEIDLGSADNVKSGLKFSVQPSDTPTRGFESRKRLVPGQGGKPEMQVMAKGKIEVIQTLGAHLSQARIVEEPDRVRNSVLAGDLLYNSVWRKGEPDHVALIGIFDLSGDGSDDIKTLVRDLNRMGIVVDAFYDLDQMKWVGKITEKTIYAIEGYVPFKEVLPGEPPSVLEAKAQVLKGIGEARQEAKDRGSKLIRMRDFFPRIGYPVNLDVSEKQINQAASRYLKTRAPMETGM